MPTYITGSSNYPQNFDLVPTGVTSPTVTYVLDELRDPITGVITQSGNTIIARNVNSILTIMQNLQETLGLNIEDVFSSVAQRLNYLQYSGSGAFVPLAGGSMFGNLTVQSGVHINTYNIVSNGLSVISSGNSLISSSGLLTLTVPSGLSVYGSGSPIAFNVNDFGVTSSVASITSTNGLTLSGNVISLNSTGNVTTNTSIIPGLTSSYDLGSPSLKFANVYADNIVSTGVAGNFLSKTGDTTLGNLILNTGISLLSASSGTSSIGSSGVPMLDVYTKTLYASFISGLSPVTLLSDIVMTGTSTLVIDSGASISFVGSGTTDLGSASNPVNNIYANNIVSTGVSILGLVHVSGETMTGDLTFSTGTNVVLNSGSIYPQTSGVGTVGNTGNYFENVYTNNINNRAVGNLVFNEVLAGTVNGVNKSFTLAHAPISGYANIFTSGILLRPISDYVILGTTLTITGSIAAPSINAPMAGFYIY